MLVSQIIIIIISTLALLLNSVTLYITGCRLKFKGIDLILMSLVAIFDMVESIANLARMIALETNWIIPYENTVVWCVVDSTIMLTINQTTFETIAMLSLLRCLAICHNKQYRPLVWIKWLLLSFLTSLGLSLGNGFFPNVYIWEESGLICLPKAKKDSSNYLYFTIWDSLTVIRILIALFIINFCYYKVSVTYRKILKEQLNSIELSDEHSFNKTKPITSVLSSTNLTSSSVLRDRIRRRHKIISTQLFGIAIAYNISIVPVVFIIIHKLTLSDPPSLITQISIELTSWTILLINPLFVLVSHEPSRREVTKIMSRLFRFEFSSGILRIFSTKQ